MKACPILLISSPILAETLCPLPIYPSSTEHSLGTSPIPRDSRFGKPLDLAPNFTRASNTPCHDFQSTAPCMSRYTCRHRCESHVSSSVAHYRRIHRASTSRHTLYNKSPGLFYEPYWHLHQPLHYCECKYHSYDHNSSLATTSTCFVRGSIPKTGQNVLSFTSGNVSQSQKSRNSEQLHCAKVVLTNLGGAYN